MKKILPSSLTPILIPTPVERFLSTTADPTGVSNRLTDSYCPIRNNNAPPSPAFDIIDYHSTWSIYAEELSKYLVAYLASEPVSRSSAIRRLTHLTDPQFHQLSTDVYDELNRRKNENEVPFLLVREDFHPKRNQARQILATLPTPNFKNLSSDVYFELARRYPEFLENESTALIRALRRAFSEDDGINALLELESSEVQHAVDVLQAEIYATSFDTIQSRYHRRCRKCLWALVNKHHILPASLFVNEVARVETDPVACGGFADIYKGIYRGRPVGLKVLRFYLQVDQRKKDELAEDFHKEALLWTQLNHPNVLSFHGISATLLPRRLCLVSPWMDNGDIITFLDMNPGHDKLAAILEIAAGIAYLHELRIVHGDIKGVNILVNKHGKPQLADFGLAIIVAETLTQTKSITGDQKGSLRWMAPELFHLSNTYSDSSNPGCGGERVKAKTDKFARDIYAFACTILEIITGKPPFADIMDPAVMFQVVLLKSRPPRPSSEFWCPGNIWDMIEQCWAQQVKDRPKASEVHTFLSRLVDLRDNNPGYPWENRYLWELLHAEVSRFSFASTISLHIR